MDIPGKPNGDDGRFQANVGKLLARAVEEAAEKRAAMISALAMKFLYETGLRADQVELVEQETPTGRTWFFRRRPQEYDI